MARDEGGMEQEQALETLKVAIPDNGGSSETTDGGD
jgi:hypothetical protein